MGGNRISALICFGGKFVEIILMAAGVNKSKLKLAVYFTHKYHSLRNFLYETSSVSGKGILKGMNHIMI